MYRPYFTRESFGLGGLLIFSVGGPVGALVGYLLASSLGVSDATMPHIIAFGFLAGILCTAVALTRYAVVVLRNRKQ